MKKLIVCIVAIVSCSACAPFQPSSEQANQDVAAMTFQRHQNGLCFGVVRFNTYSGFQGVSITNVPEWACKK